MATQKTYTDKWKCPKCGDIQITRRHTITAGKFVKSYCGKCHKYARTKAGNLDEKINIEELENRLGLGFKNAVVEATKQGLDKINCPDHNLPLIYCQICKNDGLKAAKQAGEDKAKLEEDLKLQKESFLKACEGFEKVYAEKEEHIAALKATLDAVKRNDKTPTYPYKNENSEASKNAIGKFPPKGARWLTPRELAIEALK